MFVDLVLVALNFCILRSYIRINRLSIKKQKIIGKVFDIINSNHWTCTGTPEKRRMRRHIQSCISEVEKSSLTHRHGAIIVYRSRILASAHNYFRSHLEYSTHAEIAVLKKFLDIYPKKLLQKCTLIVIRVNRSGVITNSTPCDECHKELVRNSVSRIVYSTSNVVNNDKPVFGNNKYSKVC